MHLSSLFYKDGIGNFCIQGTIHPRNPFQKYLVVNYVKNYLLVLIRKRSLFVRFVAPSFFTKVDVFTLERIFKFPNDDIYALDEVLDMVRYIKYGLV